MYLLHFLLGISLANASTAVVDEQKLVSMAVGQLSDQVVTSRDVNANFFIESALYGKQGGALPTAFYGVNSKEFGREVVAVLMEWVVFLESKGFAAAEVSGDEISSAKSKLDMTTKKNKLWKELALTPLELDSLIRRKLRSKKFIRFKVDSSVIPVTDDEAREYFEANRLKFGNLPFENFRENIITFLSGQQIDRRLKDWFEVLQNKYKVRNFIAEQQ